MFNYSEILKACRKQSGFTQRQLSSLTGISVKSIVNWENKKFIPNVVDFERILNAYGLTLNVALMKKGKEE